MNEQSLQFVQSVRLLRQLHGLIAEGKGDAPEADAVRDAMDDPWYGMSAEERELTRLLSADLYTLSEAPPKAQTAAQSARDAFAAAFRDERWSEVLTLLHREPGLFDAPGAAFVRTAAWLELGYPEIAKEFIALAARRYQDASPVRRRRVAAAELPTLHCG